MAEETAGGGEMIRTYFNHRAVDWNETSLEAAMTKLELMVKRLNIKPGSTVLDAGSGTGVLIPFLLSQIGREGRLMALDFAEEMLKRAQAKGYKDVAYLHADVTSIPVGDEVFDVVVCYSSFPHFRDKLRALAEINRVTKGGGRLLICHTSSRAMINQLHRQIPAVENDIIPDEPEMQFLLSRAGFTDIKIDDSNEGYLARARKLK